MQIYKATASLQSAYLLPLPLGILRRVVFLLRCGRLLARADEHAPPLREPECEEEGRHGDDHDAHVVDSVLQGGNGATE